MELWEFTALELGGLIQRGEVSPTQAAQVALDRMAAEQDRNNAFVTRLDGETVLAQAAGKGSIHWKKAARKVSRLARAVNAVEA